MSVSRVDREVRIACRQGDHRAVRCVVTGVRNRIVQVIADRDPYHLQNRTVIGRCEHHDYSQCQERDRRKQIRAGFAGCCPGVIDPLSYRQISQHNKNNGNDRKERRKRTCPEFGPSQNIRIISGQIGAEDHIGQHPEDHIGQHRAERCQKIAQRDLRYFDLVALDPGPENRLLHCFFQ